MRFFYYGVSTMYKYGKPVHTYIIYNKNLKPKKEEITEGSFTFKPNIIYLSEIYLEDVVNRMEENVRKYNKISELDELMLAISPALNSNGSSSELIAQAVNLSKGSDKIDKIFNIISTLALKFLTTDEISELMEAIEVTGPIKDLIDRRVEERVEKELEERVEERVEKELEERVEKELEERVAKEKEQSIISVLHLLTDKQIADSFRVDINYVRELRKKIKDKSNVELAKSNSFNFIDKEK